MKQDAQGLPSTKSETQKTEAVLSLTRYLACYQLATILI